MLALNGMIGAGIFALPAALGAEFGTFSPWLFLVFGASVFLIAIPLAELAALTPATGGPIVAVRMAFGRFAAFEIGWAYYVARIAALAANAVIFADYAARGAPFLATPLGETALILFIIGATTLANIVGVRRAAAALNIVSALKIAPLIILAVIALAAAGGVAASSPPPVDAYGPAALLVLYAFVGFEAVLIPAGETRRAETVIPRALLATIAGTAVFYFLIVAGYVAVMGEGPAPDAPLVALADRLMGPAAAGGILIIALFSIAGNFLSNLMATPRVPFALAEEGVLPAWFAQVHVRYKTPANSIGFMGVLAAALALTGAFVELAVVSTLARLIVYLASLAALPIRRLQSEGPPRPRALRFLFGAVWLGGVAFCLWAMAQSTLAAWRTLGLLLLVGLALYFVARGRQPNLNQTRS